MYLVVLIVLGLLSGVGCWVLKLSEIFSLWRRFHNIVLMSMLLCVHVINRASNTRENLPVQIGAFGYVLCNDTMRTDMRYDCCFIPVDILWLTPVSLDSIIPVCCVRHKCTLTHVLSHNHLDLICTLNDDIDPRR